MKGNEEEEDDVDCCEVEESPGDYDYKG